MRRLIDRIARWLRGPPPSHIEVDTAGFRVVVPDGPENWVSWDRIEWVIAFKRDLWTVDCITLAVGVRTDDGPARSVLADEDMAGWEPFLAALGRNLPDGLEPGWWDRVAQPPFEPCLRTIFHRRTAPPPPS